MPVSHFRPDPSTFPTPTPADAALTALFEALADVLNPSSPIEALGQDCLRRAAPLVRAASFDPLPLAPAYHAELAAPDALSVSAMVAATPLPWAFPETSADPAYVALADLKAHVELVGPEGLVHSDETRLGLYGLVPGAHYGRRTHPAEEVFVMLAGRAEWLRGDAPFVEAGPGERSYHPSMLPHATQTGAHAFMSLYIWRGDIRTDDYVYHGPADTPS